MPTIQLSMAAQPDRRRPSRMHLLKRNRPWRSFHRRYQVWEADMTLRHCWFRVWLHLRSMARCPRHRRWHWRHLVREFYDDRKSPQ
jgi:hypothetical protein